MIGENMSSTELQFSTFFLDGLFFGIPVLRVQEVLRSQQMTPVPLAPRVVSGLINLRGQIVTAIDLRRRLGLPERPSSQEPMNVVIRTADGAVSLLVDEIGDVIDVNADAFECSPENVARSIRGLLDGVYKLEKKLLLVLNVDRTVELEAGREELKVAA
jgi:purine-binding chemotaxis protein CheW